MPRWLQVISHVNPLRYQVEVLRGLLRGVPARLSLDVAVLTGAAVLAIVVSAAMLTRQTRQTR